MNMYEAPSCLTEKPHLFDQLLGMFKSYYPPACPMLGSGETVMRPQTPCWVSWALACGKEIRDRDGILMVHVWTRVELAGRTQGETTC